MQRAREGVAKSYSAEKVLARPRVRRLPHATGSTLAEPWAKLGQAQHSTTCNTLSTIMYSNRQLAYAPTPYIPRSTLSATINLDEVCTASRQMGRRR